MFSISLARMKGMRIVLIVFVFLFFEFSFASNSQVLSFYRNQQSLFSSGQARRTELEKAILSRELSPWFRITWNKKEYDVPGTTLTKDLQLTRTLISKQKTEILKSPQPGSARSFSIPANTLVVVLKVDSFWAEVVEPKQKLKGWVALHYFHPPAEDKGVFLTVTDSFLLQHPKDSSEIITTIPRGYRLIPQKFEKNYVKVQYQGRSGYIDLSSVIGRSDFAMWAFHTKKGWLGISHRENEFLLTVDKQKLKLEDFLAYASYQNRGIVTQKTNDDGPSIRSRVEIISKKAHRWTQSLLTEHGKVWWRSDEDHTQSLDEATEISSEQLMKRRLHGVAFAPGTPLKGLVSADGVFRTEDGKNWQEIPQFSGQNFPVSIHPEGVWYVGNYRSYDEGKTFEPYIMWDKLTQQIQDNLHKVPRHLRITQIEPMSHSRIRIFLDTGVQKIKMQAHILSQEWSLVK